MFIKRNLKWLSYKTAMHPYFHFLNIFLCLYIGFATVDSSSTTGVAEFVQIWTSVVILTSTVAILFVPQSLVLAILSIIYWLCLGFFLIVSVQTDSSGFFIYLPSVITLIAFFGSEDRLTASLTRFFLLTLSGLLLFAFQQQFGARTSVFIFIGILASFTLIIYSTQNLRVLRKTELAKIRIRNLVRQIYTEKKNLQIKQRLESNFLASFVHDLRQPIHAINLYISSMERVLIKLELADSNLGRLSFSLRRLKMSVKYMNNVLDGLLEATKLEQGIISPTTQPIDLIQFAKGIVSQYSEDAAELGLKLEFKSKIAHELYISTDPRLLERILRNLISNALKFTDSGGVRLRLKKNQISVTISVIDTGKGIPLKLQEKIFDEFSQVSSHTEILENNGLGLGLSIAKRLTSKIGGELIIRSSENLGSIFSIRLPATYPKPFGFRRVELEQAMEQTVIPQITLTDPQTTIILLVDEDRTSRDAFNTLEPELNLRIISGSNSQTILNSYTDLVTPPKLIIVNTSNQKEKPMHSIDKLNMEFNEDFPVIFLSSDIERESILYKNVKYAEFMQKPLTINEIQTTISRLLELKI